MFPMRACVVGGERTGGQPGAPNCNLQPGFQTGPAPAGSWKSGKSVITEGMEKQGVLVLHICLATHPFEISTLPFLVSFLSQTFIILFFEILCICVGICIWVQVPTEAMGSLAVRVKGRRKVHSVGAGDWAQVSIQSIQYTVYSIQSSAHSKWRSHRSSPWLSPMQFPAEIKPFYRTFPFWWYLNWNMVCMGFPDEMQDTCWDLTDAHRIVGNIKKTFIPWNYPLLMDLDGLTLATLSLWPFLLILCKSARAHSVKQRAGNEGEWCRRMSDTQKLHHH